MLASGRPLTECAPVTSTALEAGKCMGIPLVAIVRAQGGGAARLRAAASAPGPETIALRALIEPRSGSTLAAGIGLPGRSGVEGGAAATGASGASAGREASLTPPALLPPA